MSRRQSSIELVRVLAMLMVVLIHINNSTLVGIEKIELLDNPIDSFVRLFWKQLCIVAVNMFVLISGWFGISASIKGFINILFQVFFYSTLALVIGVVFKLPIPWRNAILAYIGGGGDGYWFIPAYLCLYVLSPVLNRFVDSATPKLLFGVVLAFFVMEFALDWFFCIGQYESGYSTIHFVGLYLLARFVNKCNIIFKNMKASRLFCMYLMLSLVPTMMAFFGLRYFGAFCATKYSSPFVVAAALFLFLSIEKLPMNSLLINWTGVSVFSVYLLHQHPIIRPYFNEFAQWLYSQMNLPLYILFSIVLAIVFLFACVVIDKSRIASWRWLSKVCIDSVLDKCSSAYDIFIKKLGILQ